MGIGTYSTHAHSALIEDSGDGLQFTEFTDPLEMAMDMIYKVAAESMVSKKSKKRSNALWDRIEERLAKERKQFMEDWY